MIRKTSILLFVLLLLPAMDAAAQNRPTRKALLAENEVLRFSLDSLQTLLDSLESRRSHEDSLLMSLYVGNEPEADEPEFDYTPEVADSLLQLWYRSYAISDFDAVHEYDMDSVRFTSDVSDEEMVRRLADMNSFISLPFNDNVKNYIILYSEKMKERMGRILGLSQYYFPVFEDILSKYSLPLELKYMAIVESMLNPTATSRAGAKGIWQFMYATGRSYGLEITSYVDERMDVEKSMDAAARYLSDAYRIFGDWALAMSSYNCGAGNVSKAIRRAGGSMDYWDIYPYLPRETRGYVPAFVGVMYAMTYHQEYGIEPQDVGMPAATDTFEIRKNLHFRQISDVVGVPIEEIETLNPQYFNNIIPGDNHSYILRLPSSWTGAFLATEPDSLYGYKRDSLLSSRVIRDVQNSGSKAAQDRIAYRVRSGDYLGKIAGRYGVSVSQLKRWNNLRSSNIRRISQGRGSRSLAAVIVVWLRQDIHHRVLLHGQVGRLPLQYRQALSRSERREHQGGERTQERQDTARAGAEDPSPLTGAPARPGRMSAEDFPYKREKPVGRVPERQVEPFRGLQHRLPVREREEAVPAVVAAHA